LFYFDLENSPQHRQAEFSSAKADQSA